MPKEIPGANASPTSNYSPLLFPGEVTWRAELRHKRILRSHCLAWGHEGNQLLKDKGLDLKSFHPCSRTPKSGKAFPPPHKQAVLRECQIPGAWILLDLSSLFKCLCESGEHLNRHLTAPARPQEPYSTCPCCFICFILN